LKVIGWIALGLALLGLAAWLAGRLGALRGTPPSDLGVHAGRLKPPSRTPNSVSSQADLYPEHPMREGARIAPLPASDGAAASIARVRAAVERMSGATVVEQRDDYLYAQFETPGLHFVDDVEFWYDPAAHSIAVRSASRIGRRDFGVNRARIEAIRAQLLH
jgi:uncharacterized protein (DUF1499 family)